MGPAPDRQLLHEQRIELTGDGAAAERRFELEPSDWSGYSALVLEARASSAQQLEIVLVTDEGESPLTFMPFEGVWTRSVIPLSLYSRPPRSGGTQSDVYNKLQLASFLYHWGPYLPLTSVRAIVFRMELPVGAPMLEVRSLVLSAAPPEEAILEERPLVDELGQWISASWPEKVGSVAELEQRWAREEASLDAGDFGCGPYGGYLATQTEATGFFRTEKRDGRWWLVDPEGHLFFSTGANLMWPFQATPTKGREGIFAELPPGERLDALAGEPLEGPSFVFWNTVRRHGEDWRPGWIDLTARRMQAWGLNTVGNWSATELTDSGRLPHTLPLFGWSTATMVMGLPDVYSEEFVRQCDEAARAQCAPRRDDPYLVGYFVHNEPPWAGREPLLVELILEGPQTELRKRALAFLAAGDTPERRRELIYDAFERFLEVVLAAIRRYDPNHLTLGMRFSGDTPAEMLRAARAFDVVSLNRYDAGVPAGVLERFSELTGKPLMIGEFHFGVPGRGMASALRTVASQADRARAYRFYVEQAASFPAFVGAHWFQWTDEPSTGRSDGECYSVGLVDVTDQPYGELVEGLKETHRRLCAVHAGELEPYGPAPRSVPRDGR